MGRADHNITFVMATTRVSISDRIYGAVVYYFVTVNPQVLQPYISLLKTDSKVFHMRKGDAAIHTCVETGFPYSAATERERKKEGGLVGGNVCEGEADKSFIIAVSLIVGHPHDHCLGGVYNALHLLMKTEIKEYIIRMSTPLKR